MNIRRFLLLTRHGPAELACAISDGQGTNAQIPTDMTTDEQIRTSPAARTPRKLPSAASAAGPRPVPDTKERIVPVKTEAALKAREAAIDAALEMTFPASDPPSWTN